MADRTRLLTGLASRLLSTLTTLTTLLPLTGGLHIARAEITPVWKADEKGVLIEAEDVDLVLDDSTWESSREGGDWSGNGYLRHTGGTPPRGELHYHIHVPSPGSEPGNFTLAVRTRVGAPTESDGETEASSGLLRAHHEEGGSTILQGNGTATEGWTILHAPAAWEFSPGNHRITLTPLQPGICIDRIYLAPSPPSDSGADLAEAVSTLLYPLEFDDVQPPEAPPNLRLRGHGCAHLDLIWDASEDHESGILRYDVFWRRRLVGHTYQPAFIMSGLEPYSLYHVSVAAVDLGGNSSPSTSLIVETDPFRPGSGASAKWAPVAPVIDGEEDELWSRQQAHPLTGFGKETEAAFRLAWDAEHLYVFLTASPRKSPPAWTLYLDPSLNQSSRLGPSHFQCTFPDALEGALSASREDEDAFRCETAVPWSVLGTTPATGHLLGLNLILTGAEEEPPLAWRWDRETGPAVRPYQFGVVQLAESILSGNEQGWLPPQIWRERDGHVIVEAEAIAHDPAWKVEKAPAGFTGQGLLTWKRPAHHPTPADPETESDYTAEQQGPQNKWLIVRVFTEKPGPYQCDVRFRRDTAEHRAWLWRVGGAVTSSRPIQPITLEAGGEEPYAWSSRGSRPFHLKRGINNLYLSAAGSACAIDRIVLYQTDSPAARDKALDPDTHPSQPFR